MKNYRSYLEINLPALAENIAVIRQQLNPKTQLMAVVKANAYGHGIAPCVSYCDSLIDAYGVATFEEAMCIRAAGSKKTILIFGSIHPSQLTDVIHNQLTLNLYSKDYAAALSQELQRLHQSVLCHVEIDTGLNRTGIQYSAAHQENLSWIASLYSKKSFHITGIYTHFSCADSDRAEDVEFTRKQFSDFQSLLTLLHSQQITTGIAHCVSSAGLIYYPEYQMDMVRIGMLIYGQFTSDAMRRRLGLKPVITWKSAIVGIKHLNPGESVSYSRSYTALRPTDIAIIATGYADGYKRSNSNRSYVLIHGFPAPVIGMICMDFLIADITDLPDRHSLSYATLLGEEQGNSIPVNALAFDTVNGDVTASISSRVSRIYLEYT